MKLSFSTNGYVRHSVFTAVERIAAAGYEAVELLADVPHLFPLPLSHLDLQRLQSTLQKNRLKVANINANTAVGYYGRTFWEPLFEPSLANADNQARRWRIEYTKNCIELAHHLGCPQISVTSGSMLPGVLPEQSMAHLRSSLEEVVSYGKERCIRIGIEYEPGLLIASCNELQGLLKDIDSPFLGANLDLGHSHVLGEDAQQVINDLGSKIFHIHLEDIKDRKHYHLIPGTGDMDFTAILEALDKQSYKGYLTVELYTYPDAPDKAARQSLHFLQKLPFRQNKEKELCA